MHSQLFNAMNSVLSDTDFKSNTKSPHCTYKTLISFGNRGQSEAEAELKMRNFYVCYIFKNFWLDKEYTVSDYNTLLHLIWWSVGRNGPCD